MLYDKYLVTGAKDPVGRLVVQLLLSEGCSVRVLVPPETDSSLLKGMGAEISEGEIIDKDSLKEFFAVADPRRSAVIHTEEIVSISNNKNLEMRRVNVAGAENIIDMAMRAKIGRFVYLGSAYSLDPDSALSGEKVHFDRKEAEGDYASTKAEASEYLMNKVALNKFNASILLPTFIIGPGFSEDYDMNRILRKYLEKKVSTVAGGHAFVDVRNVATALVSVCENGEPGGAYILNGEYKSAQDFFAEVSQTSGTEMVKEMPKWTQGKTMAKFVDTFYRITKKDNPKEVYALFMNSPDKNYESTVNGLIPDSEVRKVSESLTDVLKRPGNEVQPDKVDFEKVAEAAKDSSEAKPVEETSHVSEAVLKRAEESAARAAQSGEDAEKRAAAAAAARARVQARIDAAKQREEMNEAVANLKKPEEKPAEDSLLSGLSVAAAMEEAKAKRDAQKAAVNIAAPAQQAAPAPVPAPVVPAPVAPAPVAPAPAPAPAPVPAPKSAPAPAEDNSAKPMWERVSGEEITEEEIFGDDQF